MQSKRKLTEHFYGTTTVGEKGQVCIPSEARQAMNVEKGEKLLAFGMDTNILVLVKLSELEKFETHLSERLESIRSILATNREQSEKGKE